MEHVEGSTLAALANGRGLPLDDACRYAAQVIHAVAYAHDCGIVHGDLKSSNIMIARDRRAKILDFGLAIRLTNGGRERQRVDALAGDREPALSRADLERTAAVASHSVSPV